MDEQPPHMSSEPQQPHDEHPAAGGDDKLISPEMRAAMDLWEPLAAFAWDQYLTEGRGVILIDRDVLMKAAAAKRAGQFPALEIAFVAVTEVPPGDDFLRRIRETDPQQQIAIIVRDERGEEQLYVVESCSDGRPPPRECYFHLQK